MTELEELLGELDVTLGLGAVLGLEGGGLEDLGAQQDDGPDLRAGKGAGKRDKGPFR